ncbi:unnamed protein product [Moneuplotes crassus]|uniref:Uncharacterized protein n=1 Tax=Euplotes crassus TaxID=5936 RepID=A0AAD1Y1P2_EUPCR|nr:unnamed protein product [Moneuplotes crassus]
MGCSASSDRNKKRDFKRKPIDSKNKVQQKEASEPNFLNTPAEIKQAQDNQYTNNAPKSQELVPLRHSMSVFQKAQEGPVAAKKKKSITEFSSVHDSDSYIDSIESDSNRFKNSISSSSFSPDEESSS